MYIWFTELYNFTPPRQMKFHTERPNKTLVPPITKKLCAIDTHSERKVSFLQGSDKEVYKPYSRTVTISGISWTVTKRFSTSVYDCGWEVLGLVLYALLVLCLDWLLLLFVETEKKGEETRVGWVGRWKISVWSGFGKSGEIWNQNILHEKHLFK